MLRDLQYSHSIKMLLPFSIGRYNKHDVKKYIQFNTAVRTVTFDDKTEKFTVVAEQVSN